jgi:hypothetical protein
MLSGEVSTIGSASGHGGYTPLTKGSTDFGIVSRGAVCAATAMGTVTVIWMCRK